MMFLIQTIEINSQRRRMECTFMKTAKEIVHAGQGICIAHMTIPVHVPTICRQPRDKKQTNRKTVHSLDKGDFFLEILKQNNSEIVFFGVKHPYRQFSYMITFVNL